MIGSIGLYREYAIWRFNVTGVSGKTIKNDISAINTLLLDWAVGMNLHNHVSDPINRICRGIDSLRHKLNMDNKALINRILDPMLELMPTNARFYRHMRVLFAVAKAGALRRSNVCYTNKKYHIRMKHVKFYPTFENPTKVVLKLPYSKTNQPHSYREELRPIYRRTDGGPCPVLMLRDICRGRMLKFEEPVFLQNNGLAINYKQVCEMLELLCETFGLDPRAYKPHSFRIGGATDEYLAGVSVDRIMIHFGWESKKVAKGYIRTENDDLEKFE